MHWLGIALSIFGAIQGVSAGRDMERLGREQERLAEQNALLAKRELQEETRRQEKEDARIRSRALARSAASGARISGSPLSAMMELEEEQGRQLSWMKTAGASRIRLQQDADRIRARSTRQEGRNMRVRSLFGAGQQIYGIGTDAGWFGTGDKG